jgi:hypothetical protein
MLPAYTTYEDGTAREFRNVGTKFRRRGITQRKNAALRLLAKFLLAINFVSMANEQLGIGIIVKL